ncbi:hypothetical protein Ddye_019975 [Dipteronia dyeriana]|uniref:Uncharacterized protein n=1 Tax=Dipteronia dyeriana TaxID=168575 RepID=A0AAD9TYX3_9ROSI|nr:hypothetical protein Ddye_019975 [Dipteronia dyeriana]
MHGCLWKRLCKSKIKGGLGFRDLEVFNRALPANQCWRIIKIFESLSWRTLKGCYFPNCDFLEVAKKTSGSFLWNSLLWRIETGVKPDTAIWHFEGNEVYSVKSGYWLGCHIEPSPTAQVPIIIRIPIGYSLLLIVATYDTQVVGIMAIYILFSKDCGLDPCVLESDKTEAVDHVLNENLLNASYGSILSEIADLRAHTNGMNISAISSLANRVA